MMELDRMSGDQGNLWLRWGIEIHPNAVDSSFKIVIEAMVGKPKNGDIAIDDVVFHKYCR